MTDRPYVLRLTGNEQAVMLNALQDLIVRRQQDDDGSTLAEWEIEDLEALLPLVQAALLEKDSQAAEIERLREENAGLRQAFAPLAGPFPSMKGMGPADRAQRMQAEWTRRSMEANRIWLRHDRAHRPAAGE